MARSGDHMKPVLRSELNITSQDAEFLKTEYEKYSESTIYIDLIPLAACEEDLIKYFSKFGDIFYVTLFKSRICTFCKNAEIVFYKTESADKAVAVFLHSFMNYKISVLKMNETLMLSEANTIIVYPLKNYVIYEDIRDIFRYVGDVIWIRRKSMDNHVFAIFFRTKIDFLEACQVTKVFDDFFEVRPFTEQEWRKAEAVPKLQHTMEGFRSNDYPQLKPRRIMQANYEKQKNMKKGTLHFRRTRFNSAYVSNNPTTYDSEVKLYNCPRNVTLRELSDYFIEVGKITNFLKVDDEYSESSTVFVSFATLIEAMKAVNVPKLMKTHHIFKHLACTQIHTDKKYCLILDGVISLQQAILLMRPIAHMEFAIKFTRDKTLVIMRDAKFVPIISQRDDLIIDHIQIGVSTFAKEEETGINDWQCLGYPVDKIIEFAKALQFEPVKKPQINEDGFVPLSSLYPVYIGNVSTNRDVNEKKIKWYFRTLGQTMYVFFLENYRYSVAQARPRYLGLVYFRTHAAMVKALTRDQKKFFNKRMHVVDARADVRMAKGRTVIVSKLTREITEEDIYRAFVKKKVGPIERVVKFDQGAAYVCMQSKASIPKVLKTSRRQRIRIGKCVPTVAKCSGSVKVMLAQENIPQLEQMMVKAAGKITQAKITEPPCKKKRFDDESIDDFDYVVDLKHTPSSVTEEMYEGFKSSTARNEYQDRVVNDRNFERNYANFEARDGGRRNFNEDFSTTEQLRRDDDRNTRIESDFRRNDRENVNAAYNPSSSNNRRLQEARRLLENTRNDISMRRNNFNDEQLGLDDMRRRLEEVKTLLANSRNEAIDDYRLDDSINFVDHNRRCDFERNNNNAPRRNDERAELNTHFNRASSSGSDRRLQGSRIGDHRPDFAADSNEASFGMDPYGSDRRRNEERAEFNTQFNRATSRGSDRRLQGSRIDDHRPNFAADSNEAGFGMDPYGSDRRLQEPRIIDYDAPLNNRNPRSERPFPYTDDDYYSNNRDLGIDSTRYINLESNDNFNQYENNGHNNFNERDFRNRSPERSPNMSFERRERRNYENFDRNSNFIREREDDRSNYNFNDAWRHSRHPNTDMDRQNRGERNYRNETKSNKRHFTRRHI